MRVPKGCHRPFRSTQAKSFGFVLKENLIAGKPGLNYDFCGFKFVLDFCEIFRVIISEGKRRIECFIAKGYPLCKPFDEFTLHAEPGLIEVIASSEITKPLYREEYIVIRQRLVINANPGNVTSLPQTGRGPSLLR